MSRALSLWLVTLAAYLTGWVPGGGIFQAVQIFSMCLLILACLLALAGGRVGRTGPQAFELILGTAFLVATVAAFLRGNAMSVLYGALFTAVLVSLGHVARDRSMEELFTAFRRAYVGLVFTVLLLQPQEFLASATGTVEREVGLVRFAPLGMHPNLTGLVYGGGALLFVQHALDATRLRTKALSGGMAFLCVGMVLAASARASLLGLAVAAAVGLAVVALRGSVRARQMLAIGAVAGLGLMLLNAPRIGGYLTVMLDLESSTRGVESGATGRTELWEQGVDLIFSDPLGLAFGRGLRSTGPESIGFHVESSYINLMLEVGLVFTVLIVGRIVLLTARTLALPLSRQAGGYLWLFVGLMLTLVLTQSVFNRYLIAVGNPYSLLVLILCIKAEIELRARAGALRQSWPWPRTAYDADASIPAAPARHAAMPNIERTG